MFKVGDLVKLISYDSKRPGLVLSHNEGDYRIMWLSEGRVVTIRSRFLKLAPQDNKTSKGLFAS